MINNRHAVLSILHVTNLCSPFSALWKCDCDRLRVGEIVNLDPPFGSSVRLSYAGHEDLGDGQAYQFQELMPEGGSRSFVMVRTYCCFTPES